MSPTDQRDSGGSEQYAGSSSVSTVSFLQIILQMRTHSPVNLRRQPRPLYCLLVATLLLASHAASSQESDAREFIDPIDVSYIYAAVFGSGTYKVSGRRVTMFRLPFSLEQRPATSEAPGWRWLAPVVIGYDDLG